MTENDFFNKNINALSKTNPELCFRLKSHSQISSALIKTVQSRSGETVPAWLDESGTLRPLHSTVDPKREAERFLASIENSCFLVLLGMGGTYYAEAALNRIETGMLLVIEFEPRFFAALLCQADYTHIFLDSRFRLLLDGTEAEVEEAVLNLYKPVLFGGLRTIPLRARTAFDPEPFVMAARAVEAAVDRISSDYSVQAHFGKRWFSNIVRNIEAAWEPEEKLPSPEKAAVCAAGPSLSRQIPLLKERRKELFLIAVDTSLPCLLQNDLIPDALVSIDCQHISYYHFMNAVPEETCLFLDLASPPLLASRAKRKFFFAGSHPLARYAAKSGKNLPALDTSGGNVTFAALSLAEELCAGEIQLYGADFSYPLGESYARGTYLFSLFEGRQNRLNPVEAQASAFLFRVPLEKKEKRPVENPESENSWYYETKLLRFYREALEEKSKSMKSTIIPIESMGAPIRVSREKMPLQDTQNVFGRQKSEMSARGFLKRYRDAITKLPECGKNTAEYLESLSGEALAVFATMLPGAAMIRQRGNFSGPHGTHEIIEKTKAYCLKKLDSVLGQ